MLATYYFEENELAKSLACYMKTLQVLGKLTLHSSETAGDCHFNMGVVFIKLGYQTKAIQHFERALTIRTEVVGS